MAMQPPKRDSASLFLERRLSNYKQPLPCPRCFREKEGGKEAVVSYFTKQLIHDTVIHCSGIKCSNVRLTSRFSDLKSFEAGVGCKIGVGFKI